MHQRLTTHDNKVIKQSVKNKNFVILFQLLPLKPPNSIFQSWRRKSYHLLTILVIVLYFPYLLTRIYKQGHTKDLSVYRLRTSGTVEEGQKYQVTNSTLLQSHQNRYSFSSSSLP